MISLWSLRFAALRVAMGAYSDGVARFILDRASRRIRGARSLYGSYWTALLLPLGLGLLPLMPLIRPWWTPPLFDDPENAKEIVTLIFQVEATSIALVVAVIVFSLQTVARGGAIQRLREFVADTHLLLFFYVALAGLVADGYVLLFRPAAGPQPWPATWAALLSGIGIYLIGILFIATLRAIDPANIKDHRVRKLNEASRRVAEREVRRAIANGLLARRCQAAGLAYSPFALGAGPHPVGAGQSGVIVDVSLRLIDLLGQRVKGAQATVHIRMGQHVGADSTIVTLAAPDENIERLIRRMVRIR